MFPVSRIIIRFGSLSMHIIIFLSQNRLYRYYKHIIMVFLDITYKMSLYSKQSCWALDIIKVYTHMQILEWTYGRGRKCIFICLTYLVTGLLDEDDFIWGGGGWFKKRKVPREGFIVSQILYFILDHSANNVIYINYMQVKNSNKSNKTRIIFIILSTDW